jgi:nucleoside-diphosphate-sugar epimerase
MRMKILVTGAGGECGRDLVPLLAAVAQVRASDKIGVQVPCEFVQADLLDEEAGAALVEGCQAVIHLAALLPTANWSTSQYYDVNTKATALLMQAAAAAGVEHFIYASTIWATGHGLEEPGRPLDEEAALRPICTYGLTKALGELAGEYYSRTTPLRVTVLRFCGYRRSAALPPDGALEWRSADWAELVRDATRLGQKLFDPLDLLEVFRRALALPGRFARYVVGQQFPFGPEDAEPLRRQPEQVWDRYYPGALRLFRALGVHPPELPYYYRTARFAAATGWKQRITVGELVRRYFALYGEKL